VKKVVIIQNILPHFRVSFYEGLKNNLKRHNIDLSLLYGEFRKDSYRLDIGRLELPWAQLINMRDVRFGRLRFIHYPCLKFLRGADLIIMLQWNSFLINYYLMFRRLLKFSKAKLAFWGHGLNKQMSSRSLQNIFKKFFIKQVDWWFAYTKGVKNIIEECGFSKDAITVVRNATDTKQLIKLQETITEHEKNKIRASLGLKKGPVAIFLGRMYKEKRIPFLIEACLEIKKRIPNFQMIFIGDGKFKETVVELTKKEDWIYYLKPVAGREKLIYFSLADLLLMPGLVGLVVLDSFVTRTPIVTTDYQFHSPEVEYIQNGVNGVITENKLETYVDRIVNLLEDQKNIEKIKEGCRLSSKEYSIERMVENFTRGIVKCLS